MAACKLSTLLQFVCIVVVIISNVSCDFHGGDSRKSDQVFYIAAVEIEWDYAPSGVSQVKSNDRLVNGNIHWLILLILSCRLYRNNYFSDFNKDLVFHVH